MIKKRIMIAFIMVFVFLNILPAVGYADGEPQLKSESAILIDAESGRVLFEKDANRVLYPASTTKIMTAMLVLENLNLDTVVAASREAVLSIPVGGSNMGLKEGEQLTVEQLLYGVLIQSANEACNVLAEYMSGDVDTFVKRMNEKAAELGMTNTKFLNTHGLHVPEHHTTARDMSVLARYAMQNETFRRMVATTEYTIPPTDKYPEERRLFNTNYLISSRQNASYYYPRAIGIKTGYTSQAGNCLVSAATYAGTEFIAVTLNAPPQADAIYSFIDSKALFEYGFANYKRKVVVQPDVIVSEAKVKEAQGNDYVTLISAAELSAVFPADADISEIKPVVTLNDDIQAPIAPGDVLGVATYTYDGVEIGSVKLAANAEVKRDVFVFVMNRIFEFFMKPYIFIPLLVIVSLLIALYIVRRINRKRRRAYLRSQRYSKKNKRY